MPGPIHTDLVSWIQSLDPWVIVALLLVVQLFVEMRHGRRITHAQMIDAELAGYDVASRHMHESKEISRQNQIAEEAALRSLVRAAAARRRVYFYDLPAWVRDRAREKGIAL